ncbi:MAG: cysteine dioxygenase family protein [Crocinitomicaceae bacterium]
MDYREQPPVLIQTLNDLITSLSEEERTTYGDILRNLKIPLSTFNQFCSWSDDHYTRNCIVNNKDFELILLCWNKGQSTPIHDHGGEECWVKVIEGEFREIIYKKEKGSALRETSSTTSKVNDITYMKDFMGFHSLENLSDKKSMSLHLYAKPIRNCNVFDEASKEFVNKDLTYNTMA